MRRCRSQCSFMTIPRLPLRDPSIMTITLLATVLSTLVLTGCGAPTVQSWTDMAALQARARQPGGLPAPADVEAPPATATRTPSGLHSELLIPGTGTKHPGPRDTVTVHYVGWMTNGKSFDSSLKRGRPAKFPLNRVIAGWTEGLQLMVIGERRRFWIPENLAYKGRPGRPEGMLVFDVELRAIRPAPKLPTTPANVAAPPANAKVEASGLASVVLREGLNSLSPGLHDRVTVHYSGWTTDGKLFDSSVLRGRPIKLRRTQVIAGWTEALGLMVIGEKRRVWIPQNLAYEGRPGKPKGMLVFDIELLAIAP
ncbi:MAG: FKBP-type peptidyl-prolyl cis-trans isomerase [Myxococcales bacterium]|nr:FKBP-type peptidyl-prolyl cis-trans isomerase [Myxococcales bacterium]